MKKLFLLVIMSIMFISVNAQSLEYISTRELAIKSGFTISDERYQFLKEGEKFTNEGIFYAGVDYFLYARSDDEAIQDLDIRVLLPNGLVYKEDVTSNHLAWVTFTPTEDVFLRVEVINYKSSMPEYLSTCRILLAYSKK